VTDDAPIEVLLDVGPVDLRQRVVRTADGDRSLTTKEAELLGFLATRPGEDVTREELLREVWGYRGSAVSRTVDTTVQRLRKKIERDAREPRHLLTIHGAGYRFEPAKTASPAAREPAAPVAEADRFFGRGDERSALAAALAASRLVTVTGPGGTGKTRLAFKVAAAVGADLVCELSDARDRDDLLRLVARALAVPLGGKGPADPSERIGAALAARGSFLLVLDNLEQVAAPSAELIGGWLAIAGELRVLATSREALRIGAEQVFPLDPLPEDAGVDLFIDRARQIRPDFDPDGEELEAVRGVVRRLDGLPLALELAAARSGLLGPAALLARLEDRFRLLTSKRTDLPERQRTLRAAIEGSWQLLGPDEQAALRQAAVFRGGFDVEAADEVLALPDGAWALDALEELRARSLIRAHPAGPGGELRLGMLESIAAFAAEQLDASGERAATEARHRAHYLRRGERLAEEIDRTAALAPTRRLAHEVDNLQAACERALPGDPPGAARAALVLHRILRLGGAAERHVATLRGALAHAAELPAEIAVELRAKYARALRIAGRLEEGLAQASTALEQARALGGAAAARARMGLGLALAEAGRAEEAIPELRGAVADLSAVGAAVDHAHALAQLAYHLTQQGKPAEAESLAREAIAAARAVGQQFVRANALSTLALALGEQSRWEEADAALEEATDVHRSTGQERGTAVVLANRAALHVQRGRPAAAEPLFRESIEIFARLGDRRFVAIATRNLAIVVLTDGRDDEARSLLRESLALTRAVGDRWNTARVLADLGEIALVDRRCDEAETLYAEGLAEMEVSGDRRYAAITRCNLAVCATVAGDLEEAGRRWQAALPQLAEVAGDRVQGYYRAHRAAYGALIGEDVSPALAEARAQLTRVGDDVGLALVDASAALADLASAKDRSAAEARFAELGTQRQPFDVRVVMLLAESLRAG